jgi:hypothetical protein
MSLDHSIHLKIPVGRKFGIISNTRSFSRRYFLFLGGPIACFLVGLEFWYMHESNFPLIIQDNNSPRMDFVNVICPDEFA